MTTDTKQLTRHQIMAQHKPTSELIAWCISEHVDLNRLVFIKLLVKQGKVNEGEK